LSRKPTKRPEVFRAIRKKKSHKNVTKSEKWKKRIMNNAAKCSACVASLEKKNTGGMGILRTGGIGKYFFQ